MAGFASQQQGFVFILSEMTWRLTDTLSKGYCTRMFYKDPWAGTVGARVEPKGQFLRLF